jgi:hypothetical protein
MNPSLFAPCIGDIFHEAATELTATARGFLQAELPLVPTSDALLVCFFTQKLALIVAVLERTTVEHGPLVCTATTHFREGSAPKMLSGIIATIVLGLARQGITRPDDNVSSKVLGAMKRVAEPCLS